MVTILPLNTVSSNHFQIKFFSGIGAENNFAAQVPLISAPVNTKKPHTLGATYVISYALFSKYMDHDSRCRRDIFFLGKCPLFWKGG